MKAMATSAIKTFSIKCEQVGTQRADLWCQRYRQLPDETFWSFKKHPWTLEMTTCDNREIVGQKAAQMGYTEVALNKTFFALTVKRVDAMYVLPAKTPDATDFSNARFDGALECSPKLKALFRKVKNVGLKKAGSNSLYIRGSRSRSQLKSVPVAWLVMDEVEEMEDEAIALARERLSGQEDFNFIQLSTPSFPEVGINALFIRSSQDIFHFKCPSCSRYIHLSFPDSLVITAKDEYDPAINNSHLQCGECKAKLNHKDKINFLSTGKWIESYANRAIRGFQISQLYSCAAAGDPVELAKAYCRSTVSKADEQEFYNSKLGLPHIVSGVKLQPGEVEATIRTYKMSTPELFKMPLTLGIDVGNLLHIVLLGWTFTSNGNSIDPNASALPTVVFAGTVSEFKDLDYIIDKTNIIGGIIDHQPEKRKSIELCRRFPGIMRTCHYVTSDVVRDINASATIAESINADRTSWLDLVQDRFRTGKVNLPIDIPDDFSKHMQALIRTTVTSKSTGEERPIYRSAGHDHFAHAFTYAEIALKVGLSIGESESTTTRNF